MKIIDDRDTAENRKENTDFVIESTQLKSVFKVSDPSNLQNMVEARRHTYSANEGRFLRGFASHQQTPSSVNDYQDIGARWPLKEKATDTNANLKGNLHKNRLLVKSIGIQKREN